MSPSNLFMVFDVESIGLHGEGFAVGYAVVDLSIPAIVEDGIYACPPIMAFTHPHLPDDVARTWVAENVPPLRVTHTTPGSVRDAFWSKWKEWKSKGAVLVADCAWPVEARFLTRCVDDDPAEREWDGPYPLHELASFLLAAGRDPLADHGRISGELPAHDPLADARQSARLLLESFQP